MAKQEKKQRLNALMEPVLFDRMDAMAAHYGTTRSEVARRCIAFGLAQMEEDAAASRGTVVLSASPNKTPPKR